VDAAGCGGAVHEHDALAVGAAPIGDVDQHAVCVGFVVVVDVARQHGAVGGRLALVEVRLGAGKATVYALAGADAKADVAIGAGGRHIDTARDADFTAARAGERVLQVGV